MAENHKSTEQRRVALLEDLRLHMDHCTACGLHNTRQTVVFGEGSPASGLMFVGEGPGADEDQQGRPFVGAAGKLLDKILSAAGIDRSQVYVTNVIKCRPPHNRVPQIEEVLSCQSCLEAQIVLLQPRVIVTLGNTPTKWFLHSSSGITKLRGRWFKWRGIDLMPLFHPSYLLRSESRSKGSPKDLTWQDIQRVVQRLQELQTREGA